MNDLILKALNCSNVQRAPVWLMRQAGRYLPEYRALRQRYTLWEMFHNSALAADVTRMPLNVFGMDAAILFSDILVIAEVFGLKVHFPESGGPFIDPAIKSASDVDALHQKNVDEVLHYVKDTIHLLKKDLKVPLLGFCGAPFTVASYFIEQGGKDGLLKTKQWLQKDRLSFHRLLKKIADASIDYLKMQIRAGVQAVQIFDSWANCLNEAELQEFSFPYLKQMIDAIKPFPVIIFGRGFSLFPKELSALNPSAISFDWQKEMPEMRKSVPLNIAIQGNLDPTLLKRPLKEIKNAVLHLLDSMQKDPGFIVNLGHGVLPDTPVEHVACLVDTVKTYKGW